MPDHRRGELSEWVTRRVSQVGSVGPLYKRKGKIRCVMDRMLLWMTGM